MADSPAVLDTPPKYRNQHSPTLTRARQRRYLAALAETGNHRHACEHADVAFSTPVAWAIASAEYRKRYEAAKIQGEKVLLSRYESNMDGVLLPEKDLTIDEYAKLQNSRFFRMKRLDPAYRDNAVVQVQAVGPVAIQMNFGASPLQHSDSLDGADPQLGAVPRK